MAAISQFCLIREHIFYNIPDRIRR